MIKGLNNCFPIVRQKVIHNVYRKLAGGPLQPQVAAKVMGEKYNLRTNYEGFICTQSKYIPEFNMGAYLFEHEVLKCQLLHLDRNDQNNVFGIGFRTTPYDSTGLPHILEHSVLCGSERFPVRDPFFKMINRSVATFMNAFTGADYTMYPFSSMNETDFRNLQRVYLDAVFKPNLQYFDFLQEGWRLENKVIDDPKSEYMIKGVVYNEMKGSFSETSNYFSSKFLNKILPDNTYQHCSGGDPLKIPMLTHQNLTDFHQKYYHPSNAHFYSYGNFNLLTTLQYINKEYLRRFKYVDTSFSEIPSQVRWKKQRRENIECRYDTAGAPIEQQNQIAIGYLMSDVRSVNETLLLNVLSELLIKGPNSVFYKNLIEPKLSGGYSQATGFDSSIRDSMLIIGLQDVKANDFDRILEIFDDTIDEVIENGFDADHVDSVLNNIELSIKHQIPKFGLSIMFNILPVWMHGGDILSSLQYTNLINEIRNNVRHDPNYLKEKVRHYFKNNKHRLVLTSTPDIDYEKKFSEAEKQLIQTKVNNLAKSQKKQLYADCIRLADQQKAKEDIQVLPCLKLNDVYKPPESYNLDEILVFGIPTQICTIDTNNVSYVCGLYNTFDLTKEQKMMLPLFVEIIDQMGTKNLDYRAFDKQANLYTSGIRFGINFTTCLNDLSKYQVGLSFRSYCLEQNTSKMFNLIHELIANFKFDDVKRFEMLLQNYQSALTVGIASNGHLYAMQSANALVTEAQQLKANINGIEHIDFIKQLIKNDTPAEILEQLKVIAATIFNKASFKAALNTSSQTRMSCVDNYSQFVKMTTCQLQSQSSNWEKSYLLSPSNVHSVMNIPVNYCAKSIQAVPYDHADFAALRVLGKILSAKYLLPVVREQNGAYGAGARIDQDGLFTYFSYRDPNTTKTLNTFDESGKWISKNKDIIDDQALFEAKLGVLQAIDAPIGPGNKGLDYFKNGVTQEMFLYQRQQVLNVKHIDIQRVAGLYLMDDKRPTGRFVLGPENDELKDNWTTKQL